MTLITITLMSEQQPGLTALSVLRLQSWFSATFPTGAYSYSHGLEWAVEQGDIHDRATLVEWVEADLYHGSGRNEAMTIQPRGSALCHTRSPVRSELRPHSSIQTAAMANGTELSSPVCQLVRPNDFTSCGIHKASDVEAPAAPEYTSAMMSTYLLVSTCHSFSCATRGTRLRSAAKTTPIVGVVQRAVAEILRGEGGADEN